MALVFLTGRGHYIPVSFLSLNVCTHAHSHMHQETRQSKKTKNKPNPQQMSRAVRRWGTLVEAEALSLRRPRSDLALVLWTS